jgi:hypothetical protein
MKDHHQGIESRPVAANRYAEKPTAIISGQSQAEGIASFAFRVTYEDLTRERRERLKLSIWIRWRVPLMLSERRRLRRAWLRQKSSAARTAVAH